MKTRVLILSLLCLLAGAANADSVSVNIKQWVDGFFDCLDGYGVEPADNWYNLEQITTGTDMTMSSGQTSTIDFSVSWGVWTVWDWSTTLHNTPMMSGFTYYDPGYLTISDINGTFAQYDVIVYVAGWNTSNDVGAFSDGTTTYYCEIPNPYTASLIQSTDTDFSDGGDEGTYVRFNDLTADSVTISMTAQSGSTGFGGFQIVGPGRGAAYLLSPSGGVNKDFDAQELSWVSGDDPEDSNLVVNSFDLKYYSKPVASVTADDPNFANPANTVTTVVGVSSPHAFAFDYETAYFWYIDSNVTWDTIDITGNLTETISSRLTAFEVDPSQVPPKVYIGPDSAYTWLDELVSLPTTVKELDSFTPTWTVTGPASYTGDPSLFLTNTTLVDMGGGVWEVTAQFTASGADPNIIGWYDIELSATDTIPTSGDDAISIQVLATPCEAYVASGNDLNDFDANMDCEITIDDFAAWSAAWEEDRNPDDPYIYVP